MRRLLEWIATVPFLLCFGLVLLVFDIAGRIVRPFSMRGFEAVMAALQRTLVSVLAIAGTRLHVERDSAIEAHTGYAIISNHQSMFDIALIGGLLFTNYPKYVAKVELARWIPSISLNLRRGGNAVIDRKDRVQSVKAITDMATTAQDRNVSVVIFPEGTRSPTGVLGDFRRAGTEALLRAANRLPVIPTAIQGSWRLHRLLPVPVGTRIRIRFGAPIERAPDDAHDIIARSRDFIAASLTEWSTA
jgi:1-acyl-sn-glycerol-3-phosphate acyltransferase